MLVVEMHSGEAFKPEKLLECLRGKVPAWWIPDSVVRVESMPLAATGKIDKHRVRKDLGIASAAMLAWKRATGLGSLIGYQAM